MLIQLFCGVILFCVGSVLGNNDPTICGSNVVTQILGMKKKKILEEANKDTVSNHSTQKELILGLQHEKTFALFSEYITFYYCHFSFPFTFCQNGVPF